MKTKLSFRCNKHDCVLEGDGRLLAEIKADVNRRLSFLEGEGREPTGYFLFDTSAMRCPNGGTDYDALCTKHWQVLLHVG